MARNGKRKLKLKLSKADRINIDLILKEGGISGREMQRARILDLLDRDYSSNQISPILQCTPETARRCGWRYIHKGLERALYDAPRPGKERLLNENQAVAIIAMVCAQPPEGRDRWTLELIVEEAKKRKIVKTIGRETVRLFLHGQYLKPWREKNVVHTG